MRVITFGPYNVFHYSHVRLLECAKALGYHLIVGVSTDALNLSKEQRAPIYNEQ
jgi:cytidyltransferase-like protein